MYPTTPTAIMGGVSMIVSASTTSFLLFLEPGRSISRTMWVMPALYPMKQVIWTSLLGSSLGKDLGLPRWRLDLFFGRNPLDLLARIVLREGLGLATMALRPFLWEESLGPMTGSFEFPVRHRATNLTSLVEVNQAIKAW